MAATVALPRQGGGSEASQSADFRRDANGDPILLIIKIGTSSLMEPPSCTRGCNFGTGSPTGGLGRVAFALSNLGKLVDCICNLRLMGYQVLLVTSGAVGAGAVHLGLTRKPSTLTTKQAAAAVGQCRLMRLYEDLFAIRGLKVAQLLVARTDLLDRNRFVNFKCVMQELLCSGVVPIVNENDSVAVDWAKFGDNDTLSAYCAVALDAAWLFLLTDVPALYSGNPRTNPNAKPIPLVGPDGFDDLRRLMGKDKTGGTSPPLCVRVSPCVSGSLRAGARVVRMTVSECVHTGGVRVGMDTRVTVGSFLQQTSPPAISTAVTLLLLCSVLFRFCCLPAAAAALMLLRSLVRLCCCCRCCAYVAAVAGALTTPFTTAAHVWVRFCL
eukprot:GHVU01074620.1.p1 GENE.GHVU01074620.1~~GHVU01074620.1.p1  ORF type:complete len:383 (-),score=32.55 GHVU01074620.1:379-1527(-)